MIDPEKRRRVMERSIALGHCICNPKKPCPCDLFAERDLCLCAGERPEDAPETVALTSLVKNAGCASKINQNDLKRALGDLPQISHPRVLVGSNTGDDAGIYQLDDELALVQTVDVFTPGVDDPYTFGQIAAANSLSDVYAMGGQPLTALAIIGFPIENLSPRIMTQIMRGGQDKMQEAGVPIVGGHSINDLDVKFGFSVTGQVHPQRIVTNATAQPGDSLILTKPLGVGIISFAAQLNRATTQAMDAAAYSMKTLNRFAAELMIEHGVRCGTDVTGFGLLGHLSEVARQSGVTAEVWADRVPMFDEAIQYAREGLLSGAMERNREYAGQFVALAPGVAEERVNVLYDPQTSGGLLMAAPPDVAEEIVRRLHEAGQTAAAIIGRITEQSEGKIVIKNEGEQESCCCSAASESCCEDEPVEEPCCAEGSTCCAGGGRESSLTSIREAFGAFMGEVNSPGALGLREKELLSVALSVLSKCEPCVKIHLKKACEAGLTQAEVDEAVWMAIAFGGAPTMMFYNGIRK